MPPDPDEGTLRALVERLRAEFSSHENGVAMIFDDRQAARDIRRGSRTLGEERFRAALRHQRAMYLKQTAPGEESLVVYGDYPTVRETLRYPMGREASEPRPALPGP